MLKIKVINKSRHPLPKYQTAGAAAFDIQANLEGPVELGSLERMMVPTGLYFAIPSGYEMQVRSRGSLPAKHGVIVGNSPGTVDSDYRGELKVVLINASGEPYTIQDGDRIAQVLVAPVELIELVEIPAHEDITKRGEGAFGHTGR